ncbi:hypothetical protein [Muricoccus vinaceus]|uniref:Uncharacterized protein n=1 Tax=Muricoccus vinaceus TaxID=424704 RepID=A0ABV6ILK6_9PROT
MTLRPKPPRPGSGSADPFDLWLQRSFHQAYDPVLEESVPEDLLRLCSDSRTEWVAMKDRWLKAAPGEGEGEGDAGGGGGAEGEARPHGA